MTRPEASLLATQKYIFYFLFILKFPFMSDHTAKPFVFLWECLSWVCVFLPLHMTICITKTVVDRIWIDDLTTLAGIGNEAVWYFFSFVGMVYYKRRTGDLIKLIAQIDLSFKWRSSRGKTYIDMERIHNFAKNISIFWQIAPASTVMLSLLAPLFENPMRLPTNTWYPISQESTLKFVMGYIIQSWAKMIMVSSFASGSSFYISFGLLCCGQFNLLKCSLKNIIYTSGVYPRFPETMKKNNAEKEHVQEYLLAHEIEDTLPVGLKITAKDMQINSRHLSPIEIKSFGKALKTCIQHHLDILNACVLTEDFINFFAFLRVAEMTLQICFLTFVYASVSDLFALLFIPLTFVDLLMLTYPLEHIQAQSSSVGLSLLLGPWYLVSKDFRTDFGIIISNSFRPIRFTAGKIWRLNTDLFRTVTTTAFSYYTLLSSFQ